MSNNLLDTKTVNLTEIIGNGKKYQVPSFQRDYSWGEGEWEDLWLDMIDVYEDKITHYMGAIVLQKKEDDIFYLIDGQQRITTLSIFIIAIIGYFEKLIEKGINIEENKARVVFFRRNFIGDKEGMYFTSKLKLNRNNDYVYFFNLVNQEEKPFFTNESDRLLYGCFEYFQKQLKLYFGENNEEKVDGFLSKFISQKLVFTNILVEDEISAYTIFETLNTRGRNLSVGDLFKNFIFAKGFDINNKKDFFENKWNKIVDLIGDDSISDFLRVQVNSEFKIISKKRLFKFLKQNIVSYGQISEFLLKLEKNVIVYKALDDSSNYLWKKYSDYKKIEKYIGELKLFGIKLAKPLLLAGYNNFSEKDFIKLLKMISIISFRYNVIGNKNPKDMEIEYNKVSIKISSGEIKDTKSVFEFIKNKLYILDNEFKDLFKNKEIKISKRKLLKYIFVNINNNLTGEKEDYNSDNGTIEHILPQNPDSSWEEEFPENIQESFVSRLGNYLLLELNFNKEAENKSFSEKIETYSKSKYSITKELKNNYSESGWNPATINKLQNYYADIAKNIWRVEF